ncbi:MAG: hypothetical protein ACHBN1_23270 [Heteroscytonema crispum UTEX LB 1556]
MKGEEVIHILDAVRSSEATAFYWRTSVPWALGIEHWALGIGHWESQKNLSI